MVPLPLLLLALPCPQGINPNDPGIIDPMAAYWLQAPARLPGSLQVHGASELVNIVGQVGRRDTDQAPSPRGVAIQREKTPKEDVIDATQDLALAAGTGNVAAMQAAAQELRAVLMGETAGSVYDGFPLLNHLQANPLPGQVAGEYRLKRVVDRGVRVPGALGGQDVVWELDVTLLYADDQVRSDVAVFVLPAEARKTDRLHVNYAIYSLERADFAPATLLDDHQIHGEGRLASKGFDAVWLPLHGKELTDVTIDHGSVGALRAIQVWNWRATPQASTTIQPLREIVDAQGQKRLDGRGTAVVERLRTLNLASIGAAAPERKLLEVADAALGGSAPAQVHAMLSQPGVGPAGVATDWIPLLGNRALLPQEAWDLLALEGIFPGQPGPTPYGPYHAVAVYANHRLYAVTTGEFGHDPLTQLPIRIPGDAQGEEVLVKVINLDAVPHHVQARDYGPALHDDWATCSNAPAGGHSLEIFTDKPLYGAPKHEEAQWRLGWSLRKDLGVLPQIDVFPRAADRFALKAWANGGQLRRGWQYPASVRGGDFVLAPDAAWIGGGPVPAEPGGPGGVVIGTTTPGYGVAQLPQGDLAAFHPQGLLNADLDGDGVLDALVFPNWARNPDPHGGDFIPSTAEFEPFLYLSPFNGTPWIDPQQPGLGYWTDLSYAFGAPVAPGASHVARIVKPRTMGQAMWLFDGLFSADAGFPTRITDELEPAG